MFDVIGRRKWFYLISAAVTIPGLIFILLTFVPGSNAGLKFSVAYTGGTIWEVHFRDSDPSPDEVMAILDEQGLDGEVNRTTTDGRDYILIRTVALSLDRKSTRLNSSHTDISRMPSSA